MKRKTVIIILITAVAVLGLGFGVWQSGKAVPSNAAQTAGDYQTATVRRGNITVTVSGTGNVVPSKTANLGFAVSGEIAELNVQVGDTVKAGQTLARLKNTAALALEVQSQQVAVQSAEKNLLELTANANANLAQAVIDLASAEAAYEDAKIHLRTKGQGRCEQAVTETYYYEWLDWQVQIIPWQKELEDGNSKYGKDYILEQLKPLWSKSDQAYINYTYCQTFTDAEIEASQAALQVAKANLQQKTRDYESLKANNGIDSTALEIAQASLKNAQLQLLQAQNNLDGAAITAPMDGSVTAVNGDIGEIVNPGTLITLIDLESPQVQVNIDETDLANFAVGCLAQITFESIPGQTFSGVVTQVSPTLIESNSGSSLQGYVSLNQSKTLSGKNLPIGLTASVEVTYGEAQNALVVAAQAVYPPKDGGKPYVYILNTQVQPEKREIELGLKTVALAEIKSGLSEGEKVIISEVENQ
ncbi:efflux RND transporter periplasmic adaptor subunit [Levilinea saccharolytica]|uniref:RND family efflux transporter, MFP subunit n=1 Tax=Levilinea saccharolytica TaxID=229921 RepID=A0A0M9U2X1_9CHLR|nr:efflux RND transporter periplasmic adaptor subunit [Levilinea saccharolytica]KPL91520.1 hypothetical protein ADN01_00890 [Levilinea saccharolytica]GAP19166.1 RND family efflux transporter, MFP subunit [Levilinea saccharolytica]